MVSFNTGAAATFATAENGSTVMIDSTANKKAMNRVVWFTLSPFFNAEFGTAAVSDRCMMFASQVMLQTSLQVMFLLRTSDVLALPKLWWRNDVSHFNSTF